LGTNYDELAGTSSASEERVVLVMAASY